MPANTENWKQKTTLFLLSQTISLLGSSLVQYAITWYITLQTESGVMIAIATICGFLPTFLISPFAGVWADRYSRKRLIILADAAIAISTLGLTIAFFAGYEKLWLIFFISAIRALGAGVQMPAVSAMIPSLVPSEQLTRINGIYGSIQPVIALGAPALSAFLLANAGISYIFLIDVITAIIGISIFFFFVKIKTHAGAQASAGSNFRTEMLSGISYIRNHRQFSILFLFFLAYFVFVAPSVMLPPLQITRWFGEDVVKLSVVEITFAVGMVLGGIIVAIRKKFSNNIRILSLSSVLFGLFSVGLGSFRIFYLYLGFMLLCGVVMPFINTTATVYLQENADEAYLGRIFGVMSMISGGVIPMSMLIFGPLADVMKIDTILQFSGISMAALAVLMLFNKTLAQKPAEIAKKTEQLAEIQH